MVSFLVLVQTKLERTSSMHLWLFCVININGLAEKSKELLKTFLICVGFYYGFISGFIANKTLNVLVL